jgi:hypothetical protein
MSHSSPELNAESGIFPSAHQPALFLIQAGISYPATASCSVIDTVMTPFVMSHSIPAINEPSLISPSAHQPALFLIQAGISMCAWQSHKN